MNAHALTNAQHESGMKRHKKHLGDAGVLPYQSMRIRQARGVYTPQSFDGQTSVSEDAKFISEPESLSQGDRSAGVGAPAAALLHHRRDHMKRQPKLSKKLLEAGFGGDDDDRSYKKGLFEKRFAQLV